MEYFKIEDLTLEDFKSALAETDSDVVLVYRPSKEAYDFWATGASTGNIEKGGTRVIDRYKGIKRSRGITRYNAVRDSLIATIERSGKYPSATSSEDSPEERENYLLALFEEFKQSVSEM